MKKALLYITLILIALKAYSQTPYSSWELGIFGGSSYYLGELNNQHFLPLNYALGPRLRYNYDQRMGIRAGVTFGNISGDDANSNNSFNRDRNFSFTSRLIEASALWEMNFLPYSALDEKAYLATPYFFLGIGYANHNPKASFNGILINTQSLQTEGNSYSKHILSLPMGVGIKMRLNRFGFELSWGIRKTYTDYLDDVSTNFLPAADASSASQASIANTTQYENVDNVKRGDLYNKDWYVFTGLNIYVNLTKKDVCRTF